MSISLSRPIASTSGAPSQLPAPRPGVFSRCRPMSAVATGPPMSPPLTSPNVAAAIASVTAPLNANCSSMSLPKAAPVPCPPVIVIEPAIRPRNGWTPRPLASSTPTPF